MPPFVLNRRILGGRGLPMDNYEGERPERKEKTHIRPRPF